MTLPNGERDASTIDQGWYGPDNSERALAFARTVLADVPGLSDDFTDRAGEALGEFLASIASIQDIVAAAVVTAKPTSDAPALTIYLLWGQPIELGAAGSAVNVIFDRHAELADALERRGGRLASALKLVDSSLYASADALQDGLSAEMEHRGVMHLLRRTAASRRPVMSRSDAMAADHRDPVVVDVNEMEAPSRRLDEFGASSPDRSTELEGDLEAVMTELRLVARDQEGCVSDTTRDRIWVRVSPPEPE